MTEITDFCDDIIVVFAAVLNEDIKINQLVCRSRWKSHQINL